MLKLDQRGITQILLLILLLVGLAIGIYSVQQKTHILPFAQESSLSPPHLKDLNTGCNGTSPYVKLTWDPSPSANIAWYHVYRKTADIPGDDQLHVWNYVGSENVNSARHGISFIDTPQFNLQANTHYNYRMTAEQFSNSGPTSGFSNILEVTTKDCLNSPLKLAAQGNCSGNQPVVNLSWNPLPNVIAYNIYRRLDSVGQTSQDQSATFGYVGTADKAASSFPDTPQFGLQINNSYVYYIQAPLANGEVIQSNNTSTSTPQSCPLPSSSPLPAGRCHTNQDCQSGQVCQPGECNFPIFCNQGPEFSDQLCRNWKNSSACLGSCVFVTPKLPSACIQVITRACLKTDPKSCKDFPTPCDVPEGWVVQTIKGDLNHDGIVDWSDLMVLISNLDSSPIQHPEFDINGDGKIDRADILALIQLI